MTPCRPTTPLRLAACLLCSALLLPGAAAAEDEDVLLRMKNRELMSLEYPHPGEAGDTEIEAKREHPSLDATRKGVRDAVEWVARGVDSWFGEVPEDDQTRRVSGGRIRVKSVFREAEKVDLHLRFRASIRLPNAQDRIHLLFGSENEEDLVRDRPGEVMEYQRMIRRSHKSDETFFAGLGLRFTDDLGLRLSLRDMSKPLVKLRFEHEWELGSRDRLHFQETGFWAYKDGFGETTVIDWEHDLTDRLMLRWANSGTCSEEDSGLDWFSSLSLIRNMRRLRQLTGELMIDGATGNDVDIREYGFTVKWRQPVYKDWLFGEISAGYYWEKERRGGDRSGEMAIGLGLQMDF